MYHLINFKTGKPFVAIAVSYWYLINVALGTRGEMLKDSAGEELYFVFVFLTPQIIQTPLIHSSPIYTAPLFPFLPLFPGQPAHPGPDSFLRILEV